MWRICVQDNKDLYAEEAAAQREAERRRMLSIPGLIAPSELQDDMIDQQAHTSEGDLETSDSSSCSTSRLRQRRASFEEAPCWLGEGWLV